MNIKLVRFIAMLEVGLITVDNPETILGRLTVKE